MRLNLAPEAYDAAITSLYAGMSDDELDGCFRAIRGDWLDYLPESRVSQGGKMLDVIIEMLDVAACV